MRSVLMKILLTMQKEGCMGKSFFRRNVFFVTAFVTVFTMMAFAGTAFAGGASINLSEIGLSLLSGRSEIGGDNLVFSYYDIRTKAQGGPGLSDNYFTVINKDDDEWIQAHVRVRTGQCSVELLDFDVLLSPNDVFTFDLFQAADGDTVFASCDTKTLTASQFGIDDNGCFVLDTGTFPSQLSLIMECGQCPDGTAISADDALAATRWGYVEVIGEVEMMPNPDPGPDDNCTAEQLHAGVYDAWSWANESVIGGPGPSSLPGCFTWSEDPDPDIEFLGIDFDALFGGSPPPDSEFFPWNVGIDLVGRVYHAAFDAERNLTQLSTSNATSVGFVCGIAGDGTSTLPPPLDIIPVPFGFEGLCTGVVLHRPCYSDNSPGCSSGDGELENPNSIALNPPRFAYDAPTKSADFTQENGAADMNYCFWKDTIDSTGDVQNRVGAAATFGPTQADLYSIIFPRDEVPDNTENNLFILNLLYGNTGALSHYFYFPGLGQTHYVFTFPFQHFTNQQISITKTARFDNEETPCTLPTTKFISPGLPAPGVARGEVTIIDTQEPGDSCTFNEGWIAFDLEVTGDATGNTLAYSPGSLGVVVNWGDSAAADVHSTAQMQWQAVPVSYIILSILSYIVAGGGG